MLNNQVASHRDNSECFGHKSYAFIRVKQPALWNYSCVNKDDLTSVIQTIKKYDYILFFLSHYGQLFDFATDSESRFHNGNFPNLISSQIAKEWIEYD